MLVFFINLLHFIFLFSPILVYFLPISMIKPIFKWAFLVLILTPLHWVFFDNHCVFTLATKEMGNMKDVQTDAGFSEKYLKWLYKPIMDILGWNWDDDGLNKIVNLHWGLNFILLWYFLFYIGKKRLI